MAFAAIPRTRLTTLFTIQDSFNFQVGVPYLRAKAQDYYEELGGGINSDILDEGMDAHQLRALTDQACRNSCSRQSLR
jgi:hypothetical protein